VNDHAQTTWDANNQKQHLQPCAHEGRHSSITLCVAHLDRAFLLSLVGYHSQKPACLMRHHGRFQLLRRCHMPAARTQSTVQQAWPMELLLAYSGVPAFARSEAFHTDQEVACAYAQRHSWLPGIWTCSVHTSASDDIAAATAGACRSRSTSAGCSILPRCRLATARLLSTTPCSAACSAASAAVNLSHRCSTMGRQAACCWSCITCCHGI
jgi:hypothetical protein